MLIDGGQVVAELFKDVLNQAEIFPVIFWPQSSFSRYLEKRK